MQKLYKAYVVSAVAGAVSFVALAAASKVAGEISTKCLKAFIALAIGGATLFVELARLVSRQNEK